MISLDRFDIHILSKTRLPSQAEREELGTLSPAKVFPLYMVKITAPHLAKQWLPVPTFSKQPKDISGLSPPRGSMVCAYKTHDNFQGLTQTFYTSQNSLTEQH